MIRRIATRRLTAGERIVAGVLVAILVAGAAIILTTRPRAPARGVDAAPAPAGACRRPYDAASPWNTPIGPRPAVEVRSRAWVRAIAGDDAPLTSDSDQFAPAVYPFDARTPRHAMRLSGYYSVYDRGDADRKGHGFAPTIGGVPVPADVAAPPGGDGQVVLYDQADGIEYAFYQYGAPGTYTATNGYRYHTTAGYLGRFADGLAGRGAGLPYLGGLVRACEIARHRIAHALAFAFDAPSRRFVYPASKSDGTGSASEPPEGSRLQLDPTLGADDFATWGLAPEAQTIARALQTYGMYVVDNSGSSKIFLESRLTARWPAYVTRDLVSAIPWSAFRVVAPPPQPTAPAAPVAPRP